MVDGLLRPIYHSIARQMALFTRTHIINYLHCYEIICVTWLATDHLYACVMHMFIKHLLITAFHISVKAEQTTHQNSVL